jgi:hypothetical protein
MHDRTIWKSEMLVISVSILYICVTEVPKYITTALYKPSLTYSPQGEASTYMKPLISQRICVCQFIYIDNTGGYDYRNAIPVH